MKAINVFNVKDTLATLNKSRDAGIAKATLFGKVATAAHNEAPTGIWKSGEGAAKLNKAKFPLTFAYLKELCAPDDNGVRRGDIAEFASTLRKFLSLDPASRKDMLTPVDSEAQAKHKSPWQWTIQAIRNETPKKTRAVRVVTSAGAAGAAAKKPEAHSIASPKEAAQVVSAINTWRAAIDAVITAFDDTLPEDVKALLLKAAFYKVHATA